MSEQFCSRGHDTQVIGRYTNGACKRCVKERAAVWVKANPEKRRDVWMRHNRKRPRNPCRRCGAERPLQRGNVYCPTCRPIARQEYTAEWRNRNRRVYNERKLARIRKLTGLTEADLAQVWTYYGSACVYCGAPATGFDHLQPLDRGGLHAVENLAPCCKSCNSRKGTRPIWVMVT